MKRNRRIQIWGIAALVVLVLIVLGTHSTGKGLTAPAGGTVNQGPAAPQFQLKDLKGNTVSLADFKGQKVYVKYWASWCPICLAGLDELDQLSAGQHDYKVITIVSPGYNGEQSEADFVNWFSKRGYSHIEVLLDDGGTWAKKFGVKGYPTSYYIGSDGVLAKTVPGHNPNAAIDQTFASIH
jgi:peroxiredoxin